MIPYFSLGSFDLFGFKLEWFFLLVIIGVIFGVTIYDKILKKGGQIDKKVALHLPEICIISGFIMAHLVHVLFYHPESMQDDPFVLFKIWGGYSSFGGFLGGILAGGLWVKLKDGRILPYVDRSLFALIAGWMFGRTGCAVTHDHPGILSDFILAIQFPGGSRHDLGFYELLVTIAMFMALMVFARKPKRVGFYAAFIMLTYSPIRFMFDFLRITEGKYADQRFFGLTPAQYGMVLIFLIGLYIVKTLKNREMDIAYFGKNDPMPVQKSVADQKPSHE